MQYNDNDKGCFFPQEIMQHILVEACGQPTTPRKTIVGKTDTCTNTLLKLCLVSKDMNEFAMTRLYAAVRLPKPSTLRAFQQTLSSWPFLGRLVKSLHVGADKPLGDDWWPIHIANGSSGRVFRLNLDSGSEGRQMADVRPYYDLKLDRNEDDEDSRAFHSALQAACRHLNVDSEAEFKGFDSRQDIGSDAWHVRVLEAQAALELYHLHHYSSRSAGQPLPELVLDGRPTSLTQSVHRVTRQQIYARMTRSSAPTNSFLHPLLYARCGLDWLAVSGEGYVHGPRRRPIHGSKDPSDVFAWPRISRRFDDPSGAQDVHYPSDLSSALDPAIPPSATVSGNLALARSILALTPHVSSLSLTSLFEWSIVGERFAPALPALQSLTLGPSPEWQLLLRYDHLALTGVKKLRICGGYLGIDELEHLTDNKGLPKTVREIQWSLAARYHNAQRQPQQ